MRSRRTLFAASLALVAALAGPVTSAGTSASAGPDRGRPGPEATHPTIAARLVEYAEAFDEVLDLPGAGKVVVDNQSGTLKLYWHGPVPEAATAIVAAPPSGIEARVVPADFSMAELGEAISAAWDAAEAGGAEVAQAGPTNDLSGIVVTVAEDGVAARTSARRQLSRAVGRAARVPTRVRTAPYEPRPLASRADDSAPWQAGGRMVVDGARCSTGFAVRKPDGTGRLLSAAHCDWSANAAVYDGGGDQIAGTSSSAVLVKKDWDSMLVYPPSGTYGVTYRGGINASGTNVGRITGAAAPAQGTSICVSGAGSGEHCANMEIGQTGLSFACGDASDRRECTGFVVKHVGDGVAASVGDSGAGVYVVKSDGTLGARGIISEGHTPSNLACGQTVWGTNWCSSKFFAVSITDLLDQWNVSIETE